MSTTESQQESRDPSSARRRPARVFRWLHDQISRRSYGEIFSVAKTIVVVGATVTPTVSAFVIVAGAMLASPIVMSPLKVPDALDKAGYSGDAVSQRLLDEIASLNRISVSGKPKTAVSDTSLFDSIAALQMPTSGVDVRSIQNTIQAVLGREIIKLTGEVTSRKENGVELLRLRLRRSPGRELLIDVETAGGPDQLVSKGALNLLENIDPEIAAGIYWREYGDLESADRLIMVALAKPDDNVHKYAYNLRSYIRATLGRIDEALADSDKVRAYGGDTMLADNSKAYALMMAKRLDEAMAIAKPNAMKHMDEPSALNLLGLAYQAMGQNADAIQTFRMVLKINPRFGLVYRRLAMAQLAAGDTIDAKESLLQGIALLPYNPGILYDYAEQLRKTNDLRGAATAMRRAYQINPDNWPILVSLTELEDALGRASENQRLARIIKLRIENGEIPPARLKARVEALVAK